METQGKMIQNWILDFNNDYNVRQLQAKYNRPTFFEMMAKDRSETVHSSFIGWLLQGNDFNLHGNNAPIVSFLETLVRRDAQQNNLLPAPIRRAIITRSIDIKSVKCETEYPVKKLAAKKFRQNTSDNNIAKIASKSQDKIDLLVDCEIEPINGFEHLQIIVENKILSSEGTGKKEQRTEVTEYDSADQTTRYYMAAKMDCKNTLQLFVFLTPLSSYELDDYKTLPAQRKCKSCDKYIQINYQDIADNVITPILWSDNISNRVKVLLDEYIESLTIPSISDDNIDNVSDIKKMLVMASKEDERESLLSFLNKYQELITLAILVANPTLQIDREDNASCKAILENNINSFEKEIDKVGKWLTIKPKKKDLEAFCSDIDYIDYDTIINADNPQKQFIDTIKERTKIYENAADELTQDVLNDMFGLGVVRIGGRSNRTFTYSYFDETNNEHTVTFQCAEIIKSKGKFVICLTPYITWNEFFSNYEVYDLALLYDFYKQNCLLIFAAIKILVETPNASNDLTLWQDIYEGLTSSLDYTKYDVTVDGVSSNKPLNKRQVVTFVIEHVLLTDELISNLNLAIPRMFLSFDAEEVQSFDRSRYYGLDYNEEEGKYKCISLKDKAEYSLYVSNQWGILPINSDNDKSNHPSGKGGNFGKLLDFFMNNKEHKVTIKEQRSERERIINA